jgi:hypothetical protein
MSQALLVAFTGLILASSGGDRIDESLLRGTWVWGYFKCGSDMEIIYRDGMLGNPIPKTHELSRSGDFFPIYKVISAKRRGDEARIQYRSILADRREYPVYTIIFRMEKQKYVAIRSFTDQRVEEPAMPLRDLDWTRCDP